MQDAHSRNSSSVSSAFDQGHCCRRNSNLLRHTNASLLHAISTVTMTVTMNQSQLNQPNYLKSRIGLIPSIFSPSKVAAFAKRPLMVHMSPVQIRLARQKWRNSKGFKPLRFRLLSFRAQTEHMAGYCAGHHHLGCTVCVSIQWSRSARRYLMTRPTLTYGSSRRSLRHLDSVMKGTARMAAACAGVSSGSGVVSFCSVRRACPVLCARPRP